MIKCYLVCVYFYTLHNFSLRWSPLSEQLEYVKRLHGDGGREEFSVPQIGGVEIDLIRLYELVQKYGGMKGTVGKEKKWVKIADAMKIPKVVGWGHIRGMFNGAVWLVP